MMIIGTHAIIYADDPTAARAFFKDVLGLPNVDVGDGWLIFALPPADVAAHPANAETRSGRLELYFMCDDVHETVAELTSKGVEFTQPVSDQGWGLLTALRVPGAGEIGLYQPRHPLPPRT